MAATILLQSRKRRKALRGFGLAAVALSATLATASPVADGEWPAYGRTAGGDRHSPLRQISPANVARLAVAWSYRTGELGEAFGTGDRRLEATPLMVEGRLYLSTPLGRAIALDPVSGREVWRFDAEVDRRLEFGDFASRGVSWWRDPAAPEGAPCAARIYLATIDARLIALDAATGRPCAGFGRDGAIDLRTGLRNPPQAIEEYEQTSPPAIIGDVAVVGSAIADNDRIDLPSGEVRGYDLRTGALRWTWDPVPQDPADPAFGEWIGPRARRTGGANSWSVITADPAHGLVFLPTSSPSVDYYGGERLGDNRHANSIVALRAATGERVWSFQTVHHDLWDYDNPAPPVLADLRRGGRIVPAVIIATKTGQLFVLDRRTGRPIFPVAERPVPASDVPGEQAAARQPFSPGLPQLAATRLTEADLFGATREDRAACRADFRRLRHDGPFTPPSERGSIVMPGNIGGAHWGGVAFDPGRQVAIVPVNHVAAVVTLIPADRFDGETGTPAGDRTGLQRTRMGGTSYVMERRRFATPGGIPCTRPPFGTLQAIDLARGRRLWRVPLGTSRSVAGSGNLNLGGAITTASGLVFIAATPDARLRAFDTASGAELWAARLPAAARSTPMTYLGADGRQYVVIAAGGFGGAAGLHDEFVAFALPR